MIDTLVEMVVESPLRKIGGSQYSRTWIRLAAACLDSDPELAHAIIRGLDEKLPPEPSPIDYQLRIDRTMEDRIRMGWSPLRALQYRDRELRQLGLPIPRR